MVTPDFLASDFIHEHELGPLLNEAEQGGIKVLWMPVRASAYKQIALKNYQAALSPDTPLAAMTITLLGNRARLAKEDTVTRRRRFR